MEQTQLNQLRQLRKHSNGLVDVDVWSLEQKYKPQLGAAWLNLYAIYNELDPSYWDKFYTLERARQQLLSDFLLDYSGERSFKSWGISFSYLDELLRLFKGVNWRQLPVYLGNKAGNDSHVLNEPVLLDGRKLIESIDDGIKYL
ncbi:hypothetical protein M8332_00970 [Fructilactobacillus ixorae]|uniref:Uncharacterized protein n=1 Tax=Fructilactobacillus ixorae TaxID=1750535 RepID=A0ABY5C3W5_9LACO|nr:hypothetical protein [Fructilactobacillus ixorae]USS93471.1 hypothetical protein M8332_00970 [Fructilactobacillus ixorae]